MKTTKLILTLSVLSVLILFGCGQKYKAVDLDDDGYGKTTLANGMTVLINHDGTTQLTSARILIGGGVLTENSTDNGITNLMTKMLLKGNEAMTAAEISDRLDFLGAQVAVACFKDYSAISFTSLTENFEEVLKIIAGCINSPTFPEEELAKLKHEVEGEIKASNDNQAQASSKLFWKTIYGDQGYGLPTPGTPESIADITIDDIKAHYQKYIGGQNIIFSVATDLNAGRIMALIESEFKDLKTETETVSFSSAMHQDQKAGFISFERNQSYIFTGFPMEHLSPAEVAYATILDEIMGGNVGSRLWFLRQKEKLAYSVYTQNILNKHTACFRAAIGTDTSKVKQALSSLDRELTKLIDGGITAAELADGKINMKNNLIYRIDRKSNRANNMAYYEYIGYGYKFVPELFDKIDAITVEEINQFVTSNFDDENRYTSIVGKQ